MPITARLPRCIAAALAISGLLALASCGGGSSGSSGGGGGSSSSGGSGSSGSSATGSASLTWTAPTTNGDGSQLTDLAGYHIYYGTSADLLTTQIDVDKAVTSHAVNNLVAGTYYFAVTAFNSAGIESDLSNTGSKTIN